jgi:hypothetical protein
MAPSGGLDVGVVDVPFSGTAVAGGAVTMGVARGADVPPARPSESFIARLLSRSTLDYDPLRSSV